MNKAILLGRLTKDPELTTTSNGTSVCNFTLAISRRHQNAAGERDADFINIVAWRSTADNCHKFLKKGSQVAVVGSIQTRTYDATDGTKRTVTEVVAEEVEFVSSRTANTNPEEAKEEKNVEQVSKLEAVTDEDLPF